MRHTLATPVVWKEIASKAEKGCLQELCETSNSVWRLSIMPEKKQDGFVWSTTQRWKKIKGLIFDAVFE